MTCHILCYNNLIKIYFNSKNLHNRGIHMSTNVNIDWSKLGFTYMKTDLRYVSIWKNGKWDDGKLVEDNNITISESSTALHYGQQCFEGLKAYRTKRW